MGRIHVLYNPLSGSGNGEENARLLELYLPESADFFDMTKITNYSAFLGGMDADDTIIIAGGDGTLNRFANDTAHLDIAQGIQHLPIGTGNDFARSFGNGRYSNPFDITQQIKHLPVVEVKGRSHRFLNGIGFGIDGYCCEKGDELHRQGKKVNYSRIALRGLLSCFKPVNARVTVDGQEYTYSRVWLAPTMFGRYYGGGMMPAPDQNFDDPEGLLSLMLFHGAGRFRALLAFPGIFKGTHVRRMDMVAIHRGHEISVEFDRPAPLQIDGETIGNVLSYTARSYKFLKTASRRNGEGTP